MLNRKLNAKTKVLKLKLKKLLLKKGKRFTDKKRKSS